MTSSSSPKGFAPGRWTLLVLAAAAFCLPGCATTEVDETPTASSEVSSIPWNRPASWETQGNIPGMSGFNEGR